MILSILLTVATPYVKEPTLFCKFTWHIHMCDMASSYVWHDSLICVTWVIHLWRDSLICVTWLFHTCDMTHWYVWHDCFTCVTWLVDMCDTTHSYVRHDSFIWMWMVQEDTGCVCVCMCVCVCKCDDKLTHYGVATVSRIDQIIGLSCRMSSL